MTDILTTNDFAAAGLTVTELVALHRVLDEAGLDAANGYTRDRLIAALNRKHAIVLDVAGLPDAYDKARALLFPKAKRARKVKVTA